MGWRSCFSQIYHETGQAASFLDWKDFKSIQDQATTFFRHSDLRTSHQCTAEDTWLSSNTASTGNYSAFNKTRHAPELRRVFCWKSAGIFYCVQVSNGIKKENNIRYIILHYWLHLHGVFRWNSKKYVSISVVCLYHSFTDWQLFSIRWNASRFVCLFCAFLHVLKFTQ